jgi:RHS repeat-associated protein
MGYLGLADSLGAEYIGETRDGETMLDFLNARYFAAAQGRFQSPDPGNAGASLANPQTWNGYAYVGNSPLTFTDPSGMFLPVVPAPVFEGAKDGATLCGPTCAAIGAGVGAAVELGAILWDIFGGGGPAHAVGSLAAGGLGDGSFASGNLYGDGNTSPFIFSLTAQTSVNADVDPSVMVIPGLRFTAEATAHADSSKWKHTAGCFARGLAVGAGGALVVAGAAAGAAALGVPAAVVSGGLLVVGGAGIATSIAGTYLDIKSGNLGGIAFDLGGVAGGAVVGGVSGGAVGDSINPPATRGISMSRFIQNSYNPKHPGGSFWKWLGTGPDAFHSEATVGGSGAGLSAVISWIRGGC